MAEELANSSAESAKKSLQRVSKVCLRKPDGNSAVKEFGSDEKIGSVKSWAWEQLGGKRQKLVIMHTQSPLPEGDNITVFEAGLCPSATLRVDEGQQATHATGPGAPTENRPSFFRRFCSKAVYLLCFLNPWAEPEEETFWEYQPGALHLPGVREI